MSARIPIDDLLADLSRIADNLGHPPTASEFNEESENSSTTILRRFDNWTAALEAAGLDPEEKPNANAPVPNETLLEDLERVAKKVGHTPSSVEYDAEGEWTSTLLRKRFDDWDGVCERLSEWSETEFPPNRHHKLVTFEDAVQEMWRLSRLLGSPPNYQAILKLSVHTHRSLRKFGSHDDVLAKAGLNPAHTVAAPRQELLLDDLFRVAAHDGEPPSKERYEEVGEFPVGLIERGVGSWDEACELVAAALAEEQQDSPDHRGLQDVERVYGLLGRPPDKEEYRNHGEFDPDALTRSFGPWETVLLEAGIPEEEVKQIVDS